MSIVFLFPPSPPKFSETYKVPRVSNGWTGKMNIVWSIAIHIKDSEASYYFTRWILPLNGKLCCM